MLVLSETHERLMSATPGATQAYSKPKANVAQA